MIRNRYNYGLNPTNDNGGLSYQTTFRTQIDCQTLRQGTINDESVKAASPHRQQNLYRVSTKLSLPAVPNRQQAHASAAMHQKPQLMNQNQRLPSRESLYKDDVPTKSYTELLKPSSAQRKSHFQNMIKRSETLEDNIPQHEQKQRHTQYIQKAFKNQTNFNINQYYGGNGVNTATTAAESPNKLNANQTKEQQLALQQNNSYMKLLNHFHQNSSHQRQQSDGNKIIPRAIHTNLPKITQHQNYINEPNQQFQTQPVSLGVNYDQRQSIKLQKRTEGSYLFRLLSKKNNFDDSLNMAIPLDYKQTNIDQFKESPNRSKERLYQDQSSNLPQQFNQFRRNQEYCDEKQPSPLSTKRLFKPQLENERQQFKGMYNVDEELSQIRQMIKKLQSSNETYQEKKNEIISQQQEEIKKLQKQLNHNIKQQPINHVKDIADKPKVLLELPQNPKFKRQSNLTQKVLKTKNSNIIQNIDKTQNQYMEQLEQQEQKTQDFDTKQDTSYISQQNDEQQIEENDKINIQVQELNEIEQSIETENILNVDNDGSQEMSVNENDLENQKLKINEDKFIDRTDTPINIPETGPIDESFQSSASLQSNNNQTITKDPEEINSNQDNIEEEKQSKDLQQNQDTKLINTKDTNNKLTLDKEEKQFQNNKENGKQILQKIEILNVLSGILDGNDTSQDQNPEDTQSDEDFDEQNEDIKSEQQLNDNTDKENPFKIKVEEVNEDADQKEENKEEEIEKKSNKDRLSIGKVVKPSDLLTPCQKSECGEEKKEDDDEKKDKCNYFGNFEEKIERNKLDKQVGEQIKKNFEQYQRRIEIYNNYLNRPPKEKKQFVELRRQNDEQMVEDLLSVKQINVMFFKICQYYNREDYLLSSDQFMSYLTVDGLLPNSDDIMHEVGKFGILDRYDTINLTLFKDIMQHLLNILNMQLEFREHIEDILKINMKERNQQELRSLLHDFYDQVIEFTYEKGRNEDENAHLLLIDLIKVVTLGFQNPQFYEISNLITSFDEAGDRVLHFDEFFTMMSRLHQYQKKRVVEFSEFSRNIVSDLTMKNTMTYIREAYDIGHKINLLNGKQLKAYDMIDALTNDQMNENTFDVIEILQEFDSDSSGIFDFDEFTRFLQAIRYKKILQIENCAKMLQNLFQNQNKLIKDEDIRSVYKQCTLINLLEDYRFTYDELKLVIWENPEELCFKLLYNQMKYKPKDEVITYQIFKRHFRTVENQIKEANNVGLCIGEFMNQQFAANQKNMDPDRIWKLIKEEKTVEKQMQLYDTFLKQHRIRICAKNVEKYTSMSEYEKDEYAKNILGVFRNNRNRKINRKKIIANSQQARNLFARKQSVNQNDIDRSIKQAQQVLNNNDLKDQLQHVKGIRVSHIDLGSNIQYKRLIKRYEDRVRVLHRMKNTMKLIDKDRFEAQIEGAPQVEYDPNLNL